jgi:hypothetical protein
LISLACVINLVDRMLVHTVRVQSMTESSLNELRQFFGGYFHQDWHIVAEDWDGVVAEIYPALSRHRSCGPHRLLNR